MPENRVSYKFNDQVYDIPVSESENFLKDYPDAIPVKSFLVEKDTFDIPVQEVPDFLKDMPSAKPVYEEKGGFWDSYLGDVTERIASGFSRVPANLLSFASIPLKVYANTVANKSGMDPQLKKAFTENLVYSFHPAESRAIEELRNESKKLREKSDRYEGKNFADLWKEGNYGSAIGEIFLTASESIPMSLVAMFGGGLGLGFIGATSTAEKYDILSDVQKINTITATPEEIERNKEIVNQMNMSEFGKLLNSALTGTSEALTEKLGSVPIGKWIKNIYSTAGKEVAEKTIKEGLMNWTTNLFNKYGLLVSPVSEGLEEYVNQIAQNATDYGTGLTENLDLLKDANKSFIYGAGGGAQFSLVGAPGIIYNKFAQNKTRKNAEKTINENIEAIKNDDGLIHAAIDKKGNKIFVKNETPGGMAMVVDENGNPASIDVSNIEERQVLDPEEVAIGQMTQFELGNQKTDQPETFKLDGKTYVFQEMLQDGTLIANEIDKMGQPTGDVIAVDRQMQERIDSQLNAIPTEEPEIKTLKIGENQYSLKKAEDAYVSDPFNTEEEATKIKNEFEKLIGKKNTIEVVEKDSGDPLIPNSYQVVVKPIEQLTPELQAQKEQIEAPSYKLDNEELSRVDAEEFINTRESKKELEGLTINNDPELLALIDKKFPEPKTIYKIGKKEVTEDQARARIKFAKNSQQLSELKIENNPELQDLYDKRIIELVGKITEKIPVESKPEVKKIPETNIDIERLNNLVNAYNISKNPDRKENVMLPSIKNTAEKVGYSVIKKGDKISVKEKEVIELKPKKAKSLSKIQEEVSKLDVTTPRQEAMQYFINGGKINKDALFSLYGTKGKEDDKSINKKINSERVKRFTWVSNETGKNINEIAHDLWESRPEGSEYTTQDYRNEVEDIINFYISPVQMAKNLIEELSEKEYQYTDDEIIQIESELIDQNNELTQEELDEINSIDLDEWERMYNEYNEYLKETKYERAITETEERPLPEIQEDEEIAGVEKGTPEKRIIEKEVHVKPKKEEQPIPKPITDEPLTDVSELINEAKKYKSADEFVKAQGTPVYHGTEREITAFEEIGGIGTHLGTDKSTALSRLKDIGIKEGKIIEGIVNIKNPLRTKDYRFWNDASVVTKRLWKDGIISKEEMQKILSGAVMGRKPFPAIKKLLKEKGYDGIVYKNTIEGKGTDSFIAFSPDQLKTKSQLIDIWNKSQTKYSTFAKSIGATEDMSDILEGNALRAEINGVDVIINEVDGKVFIESIKTPGDKLRTGLARKAMDKITTEADKLGITIELDAIPEERSNISQKDLIKFYKDYGFEFTEENGTRKPQKYDSKDKERLPSPERGRETIEQRRPDERAGGEKITPSRDVFGDGRKRPRVQEKVQQGVKLPEKRQFEIRKSEGGWSVDEKINNNWIFVQKFQSKKDAQNFIESKIKLPVTEQLKEAESEPVVKQEIIEETKKEITKPVIKPIEDVQSIEELQQLLAEGKIKKDKAYDEKMEELRKMEPRFKGEEIGNDINKFVEIKKYLKEQGYERGDNISSYDTKGYDYGDLFYGAQVDTENLLNQIGVNDIELDGWNPIQIDFSNQSESFYIRFQDESNNNNIIIRFSDHKNYYPQHKGDINIDADGSYGTLNSLELENEIKKHVNNVVSFIKNEWEENKYLDQKQFNDYIKHKSSDIRLKSEPFYSPTEKALNSIKQEKATPEQWKSMLLNNGAKQAELDWMGFDEFSQDKKSLNKTDIQDWINQNKIEVQEVTKYEVSEEDIDLLLEDELGQDMSREEARQFLETEEGRTKFSKYQLPGGENYKELLLTMPAKPITKSYEKWLIENFTGEDTQEAIDLYKTQVEPDQPYFRSTHFDEPNILAHIRFNERTDVDGNKVLFIEEIQSDWAQKGKKEGFNVKPKRININKPSDIPFGERLQYKKDGNYGSFIIESDLVNTVNGLEYRYKNYSSDGNTFFGSGFISFDEIKKFEIYESQSKPYQLPVPNMPFSKTNQWVNLAFHRMIRYAAENGFDRIAWTTGEQQAERYDLSKQIRSVTVENVKGLNKSYQWDLTITDNDGTPHIIKAIDDQNLAENVGKELAQKIINDNPNRFDQKIYSDLDLKVGGEGMKAFYDQMVPNLANKIGKKFGSKVEETQIEEIKFDVIREGNQYIVIDSNGKYSKSDMGSNPKFITDIDNADHFNNANAANNFIDRYLKEYDSFKVQSLPITDQMYETAIGEGFPLFKKASDFKTIEEYAKYRKDKITEDLQRTKEIAKIIGDNLGVQVKVVNYINELPQSIQRAFSKIGLSKTYGVFNPVTDDIYIISYNISGDQKLTKETILHEAIGHKGFWGVLDNEGNNILELIWKGMSKENKDFYLSKFKSERLAAEEYFADTAEQDVSPNWFSEVIAKLRELLRKLVPGLRFNKIDILNLIERSRESFKGKQVITSEDIKLKSEEQIKKPSDFKTPQEYWAYRNSLNTPPESVNENVNTNIKAARGIKPETFGEKLKRWAAEIKEVRQHFKYITEKEYPVIYNKLRLLEIVPDKVRKEAFDKISQIIKPISKDKVLFEAFERNLIFQDLLYDINRGLFVGKESPWGPWGHKSKEEVIQDAINIKTFVLKNPVLRKVTNDRNKFMSEIREALIDNGILSEDSRGNEYYFHHQVLDYMDSKKQAGSNVKDAKLHQKGWQYGRTGSMKDYNTNYLESEFEVLTQSLEQLSIKEILNSIGSQIDIMPELIEKANKEGGSWRNYIPEGYKPWYPKKGTHPYKAATLTEQKLQNILEEGGDIEDIKEAVADYDRLMWVIPEKIYNQLNEMKIFKKEMLPIRAMRFFNSSWKQWILINPFRVLKYNLNNMSGDLDIVLAYDPKILQRKYAHTAMQELRNELTGNGMSKDIGEALKYGVITSGISIQEIPDINKEGVFKSLSGSDNLISKYWKITKDFTQFRENMLRVAAYKYFKDQGYLGKRNLYGASKRESIDAMLESGASVEEVSGKLARELIGDYGNLSQGGQWLRSHTYPFWSWVEVNSPRYYRLLKNTKYEGDYNAGGKIAGVIAKKTGVGVLKLSAKMMILGGLVTLWNSLFFEDEAEELEKEKNRQLRLIMGRRKDGSIISFRISGAFSDMLSFVGFEDLKSDINDVVNDDIPLSKKIKEGGSAFINKLAQGMMPVEKTASEVIIGKSLYPDIFKPRTIRDRYEHALRFVSMDKLYRYFTKKPLKSIDKELLSLIVYESNPGETAYYTMRQKIYDFLDDNEIESPSGEPTRRSNDLYWFKQSIKLKNEKLAKYWLEKYAEDGGTIKGMRQSIEKGNVLAPLPKELREVFLTSLDKDDLEILKMADQWYSDTYKK